MIKSYIFCVLGLMLNFTAVYCPASDLPAKGNIPDEKIGVRPRGMMHMQRQFPATLTFSDLDPSDWTVAGENGGAGYIKRTREQLCWEEAVAALDYSGKDNNSKVTYILKEPIPILNDFDSVEIWMKGGVIGWTTPISNKEEPRIIPFLQLIDANEKIQTIKLRHISFPWWYAMYSEVNSGTFAKPLKLQAIGVLGCTNTKEKILYVDSVSFFKLNPKKELDLPQKLYADFITTPNTILPQPPPVKYTNSVYRRNDNIIFVYAGDDEELRWIIDPAKGLFDGITVEFPKENKGFTPCFGGGPISQAGDYKLISSELDHEKAILKYGNQWISAQEPLIWECSISGKSLIIKLSGGAGQIERINLGELKGPDAAAHFVSYFTVTPIAAGPKIGSSAGKFVSVLPCWYTSNASSLLNIDSNKQIPLNSLGGDIVYRPLPGKGRNALNEKIIFTASNCLKDVFPTIPHKASEFREKLIDRVHLYDGSHLIKQWQEDIEAFKYLKRKGVDKLLITHHSQVWAEDGQGPQEWTLTTDVAPTIGNGVFKKYIRTLQQLDYFPVLYTNYTDLQPVSPEFNYDIILRNSDGSIRYWCWPGSYPLKPLVGMQLENKYAPQICKKFNVQGSYLDVHTALTPWDRTDYDPRTPEAGSFQISYFASIKTILNEKVNYKGPVIGEGSMRLFYAGFTDADNAELAECWHQPYDYPWVVDFDLLKLHPLQIGCGMSFTSRFLPPDERWINNPHSQGLNHYLAATIAFGHAGMLLFDAPAQVPYHSDVRAYHLTQQLQKRYLMAMPVCISYCDGTKLITTEQAMLTDNVKRNQVYVKYDSGLELAVNGNKTEIWELDFGQKKYKIPPYGWIAKGPDIFEYSVLIDDHQADYVDAPEYIFFDAWGHETDFGQVITDGAGRLAGNDNDIKLTVFGPYTKMDIRMDKLGQNYSSKIIKLNCEHEDGTVTEMSPDWNGGILKLPYNDTAFAYIIHLR